MPTEPEWSSSISNSTVCTWFFIIATIDAILGVAVILFAINMALKSKISSINMIMLSLGALGAFANSWFLFLICNRSLNGEGFADMPMHKMMMPKKAEALMMKPSGMY
jgi:hypothetical protein